jgi:hypothetical protein
MADGLFLAYSDPGPVPEDEFHDWYDNEHLPGRLTVPGFDSAARYRAADGQAPPWLAVYEIEPGTLDSPAYKALYANNSDREKSILSRLATLDRREYELISDDRPASGGAASSSGGTASLSGGAAAGAAVSGAAPVILAVSMSVPPGDEDELSAWYTQEHIPMLLAVPGWRRVRRYRLTSGDGPEYLSLSDLDGLGVFDTGAYKAAVSTPWRDQILERATARERRVFSLYKSFG